MTVKVDGLYDAIADGLRTPGLQAKLEGLETTKAELEATLVSPAPSTVRLHPNLAGLYREQVAALGEALRDPGIHDEALPLLRCLIERVTLTRSDAGWQVEVDGALTALIELAQPSEGTRSAARPAVHGCSAKLVAGARNQRCLPQPMCRLEPAHPRPPRRTVR